MPPEDTEPLTESVWDYPRPPRLERTTKRLVVYLDGREIASTGRGYRVLETSHPPTYYFPPEDVEGGVLRPSRRKSFCEWKGVATYYDLVAAEGVVSDAAWGYPSPTPDFAPIRDHVAFYSQHVERCTVDDQTVLPQPGDFYGGWLTPDITGPFKGRPGTGHW